MKQPQKLIAILSAAALSISLFAGCAKTENSAPESAAPAESSASSQPASTTVQSAKPMMRVGALQGPTGLGLVQLMEQTEQKQTENVYEFTLSAAPDEVSAKLISGELDIACVPTNLAAVLYGKTEGKIKLIGVNTLGVLYLLQKNEEDAVTSLKDLQGKEIFSTGQGATQEYILSYLLEKNGLGAGDGTTVTYKTEHAELATLLVENKAEYAVLPQPFVTSVTMKDDTVKTALDLNKEWETATGTQLPMGCVVVRSDFLEKNTAAVDTFLREYADSVDYVNSNVPEAAALAGKFEVIAEQVAVQAIPNCNIVCITGEEMKTPVSAYLEVLFTANPKAVGGSLPDDAFYYIP